MNKVERLEWVAKTFGADFVLPYHVCRDWQEILSAIKSFESRGETWGMRTDFVSWNNGRPFNLQPFIQKGTKAKALKIWQANKRGLLYIVCRNILEYRVNAVAWPLCQEYIQFEFNENRLGTQRAMFDNLAELNHLVVGPVRNKSLLFSGRNMFQRGDFRRRVVHCEPFPVDFSSVPGGNVFHPFDSTVRDLKFDVVYRLFKENPETDEITFSVRLPDRKVVIW